MNEEQKKQPQKAPAELRLMFQGSIPFETTEHAEEWYIMLKEMTMSQSLKSTLNGQILKMLEPCCDDRTKKPLSAGGSVHGPEGVH